MSDDGQSINRRRDPFLLAAHPENGAASSILDDAVSALINLGYKPVEAKRAVDAVEVDASGGSLETFLRNHLR